MKNNTYRLPTASGPESRCDFPITYALLAQFARNDEDAAYYGSDIDSTAHDFDELIFDALADGHTESAHRAACINVGYDHASMDF